MKFFVRICHKAILLTMMSGLLISCETTHFHPSLVLISEADYQAAVEKNTQRKQVYDGFTNIVDLSATFMTSPLAKAQLDQNARNYQYSTNEYQSEKSKIESDLSKQTEIFVSFFVPEKKLDDLEKKDSRWKIFLDVAGNRYEGKAKKMKTILPEVVALYPNHTRWSTPYKVTFSLPTSIAEGGASKLIFTGPVTSASVEFNPLK